MAQADDLLDIGLGQGNLLAALRLDEDAEQRFGVEQRLCRGDRHDDDLVGVEAERGALPGEHADDAKAAVADAQPFAEDLSRAEQLACHLGADDAHRLAVVGVAGRQEEALGHVHLAHLDEFRGGAEHRRLAGEISDAHVAGADDERGEAQDGVAALQCKGIVDGHVARRLADEHAGRGAGRFGAARQDDDEVGAERAELIHHVQPRAFADGTDRHHGGDANAHGEQDQRGAGAAAA